MKSTGDATDAKRRAAKRAVAHVEDGMVVGLGTGSTAAYAIRELGRAVDAGLDIRGVPTSFQARELAKEVGIPLCALEDIEQLNVTIDGADQVSGSIVVKGGGAAHAREKVVAGAADRCLIVVDESKINDVVDHSIPVEVLPVARSTVANVIRGFDGAPHLRRAEVKDGPVVTDNGNVVLDCDFGVISEPVNLANELSSSPGVVEHGLFVDLADVIIVGSATGVEERNV